MLSENIKTIRKARGLSQEELAIQLNVVRQTISKWEHGLSVPDSVMLITLSEVLETPVSTLLGERMIAAGPDAASSLAEKLARLNEEMARRKRAGQKILLGALILVCVGTVLILAALTVLNSPYLTWDYNDPETAVAGVMLHGFEWLFIRIAPVLLISTGVGIGWIWQKQCRR